jgi:hemoglobin
VHLSSELFKIWLRHFDTSVDDLFVGNNAEKIKTNALNIATVLQIKIAQEKSN